MSSEHVAALDAELPVLLKNHRVAAVGAAIIRNGQIVWTYVYGYSDEGYNYLTRFAEIKLERPFESLADEYVFRHSGMKTRRIRRATG